MEEVVRKVEEYMQNGGQIHVTVGVAGIRAAFILDDPESFLNDEINILIEDPRGQMLTVEKALFNVTQNKIDDELIFRRKEGNSFVTLEFI